jgi:hypothetical protein
MKESSLRCVVEGVLRDISGFSKLGMAARQDHWLRSSPAGGARQWQ